MNFLISLIIINSLFLIFIFLQLIFLFQLYFIFSLYQNLLIIFEFKKNKYLKFIEMKTLEILEYILNNLNFRKQILYYLIRIFLNFFFILVL